MLKEFQEKLMMKAKEEKKRKPENSENLENSTDDDDDALSMNPFLSLKETLTYAKLFKEEFKMEKMSTKALEVIFCINKNIFNKIVDIFTSSNFTTKILLYFLNFKFMIFFIFRLFVRCWELRHMEFEQI